MSDPIALDARFLDPRGVEHACSIRSTSLDDIMIQSGMVQSVGDPIVCRVEGLGVLQGTVDESRPNGFRLRLIAGALQRERLAGRLRWHRDRASGRTDQRQGARIVPDWPAVAVTWTGREVPGMLRDVSASGAAIDLTPQPPLGTPVTIGRRRGTVVRLTEHGIGVRFTLPLRPEDVTEHVRL